MNNEISAVTIFNIILITGVIYGLLFCSTLFLMKRKMGRPILFLNLQVLFITLNNLQAWFIDMGLISSNVYIRYLRVPWYFLCMPMFYLFLIHYLKIRRDTRPFFNLTLGIFAGFIIIRLGLIHYTQYHNFSEHDADLLINLYSNIEEIIGYIFTMIIFIKSIFVFYQRQKLFEFVLHYDDLVWIKHYINLAGLILVIWVIAISMNIQDDAFGAPAIYYPLRLSTTIVIYWIGFKGLFRFRIMQDRIVLRQNIKNEVATKIKDFNWEEISIQNSNTISQKQQIQFEKIHSNVVDQKMYLDPCLSLDNLAEKYQISSGHLSFLINNYAKNNFSDYINQFRVEQAKKLIGKKQYHNYTIVSIGLESGFNSKSTFYKAFKKFTQMSPSEFKKEAEKK